MEIKVMDNQLGECCIRPKIKLKKEAEYLIKALCVLQIMCMNSHEDPVKFREFIAILEETTKEIENLYSEGKHNGFSINDQFNS